jgi:hypothetical protein
MMTIEACRKHKARELLPSSNGFREVLPIATLMESGVEFVAADMPFANELTIHILAPVAELRARQSGASGS